MQRIDLPNGDILLPVYFKGRQEKFCRVSVLRCAFDGLRLKFVEQGNELSLDTDRGLAEPSLARFNGRFYLTLPGARIAVNLPRRSNVVVCRRLC